jgi:hypothetical protein
VFERMLGPRFVSGPEESLANLKAMAEKMPGAAPR